MLKDVLKDIIIFNQEMIPSLRLHRRKIELDKNGSHVIVGTRRSGKTYVLYQYIQKHFNNNGVRVLFINFEDDRLIEFKHTDFQLILDSYHELYPEKPVLFLDEIQNIKYWEKFVRRLVDTDYQVFITGSNAQMLSKEIATTLGGRFLTTEIFPLSFTEYLSFHDIKMNSATLFAQNKLRVKQLFNEYFTYGGFPEVLKYSDKRAYLSNLFQKLFYSDIIVRNNIKNDKALHVLVKKMAESVNNETSVTRIKNLIKSVGYPVGTTTIFDYLMYLNDSYLLFPVLNYVNKFVDRETIKKYYFIDNGLLSLFIHKQDTKLLENLVFLHLKRSFNEIYFYKRAKEVDFYIPEKDILIQVCYDITDIETQNRELLSFKKAQSELKAENLLLITYENEKEILFNDLTIKVIPVWKWLLSNEII